MFGESIYNIIPPKPVEQQKPPMHRSKFAGNQPPTASTFHGKSTSLPHTSNIAGNATDRPVANRGHSEFGKAPGDYKNDPTTYMKSHAKTGERVLTLAELKQAHPENLAPKELKARIRFGPPKQEDMPVMNLVTSKNFVVANAVECILAAPKQPNQGAKDYLKKEDFGKVPKYLQHIKSDIDAEYQYIRELQQQRDDVERERMRPLQEDERLALIEGLKEKWEAVNTLYQGETHIVKLDTMGKMKRKEKNEAELAQLEKDIEKLSRKNIMVNAEY
eukprot:CAMPEP_0115126156 /NCGR_PEP_ID=MMETSP0227-20121206/49526_1 /TAXON_ID=89957 /ORGANISM="Polarella glacialis, Strain CCMP 1383" /LENGTH=274 /DNA_ID=CAMNT_0002529777 /DNA_START=64 /DNA_END=888 /DNA_ORIENTATION=+